MQQFIANKITTGVLSGHFSVATDKNKREEEEGEEDELILTPASTLANFWVEDGELGSTKFLELEEFTRSVHTKILTKNMERLQVYTETDS